MIEAVNEKVEVITIYRLRQKPLVMPYKVRWQGRDYTVTEVGYHYSMRQGRKLLHKFHVATYTINLRLSFDTETLSWVLEAVCDGVSN